MNKIDKFMSERLNKLGMKLDKRWLKRKCLANFLINKVKVLNNQCLNKNKADKKGNYRNSNRNNKPL